MVFPSLSPFAEPFSGAGQPTRSEPPRDRGRGSFSWLNSPRRACQLQRRGESTSRCPRLILRATPSLRFSAVPTPHTGPWVHRRPLPGHTAHHDFGRRARHRAHLLHQRREQRRKRTASTNASDGEPGEDSGGRSAYALFLSFLSWRIKRLRDARTVPPAGGAVRSRSRVLAGCGGWSRAGAENLDSEDDGGAEDGVDAEHEQCVGHSVTVEVDDVAHGGDRGTGR